MQIGYPNLTIIYSWLFRKK